MFDYFFFFFFFFKYLVLDYKRHYDSDGKSRSLLDKCRPNYQDTDSRVHFNYTTRQIMQKRLKLKIHLLILGNFDLPSSFKIYILVPNILKCFDCHPSTYNS